MSLSYRRFLPDRFKCFGNVIQRLSLEQTELTYHHNVRLSETLMVWKKRTATIHQQWNKLPESLKTQSSLVLENPFELWIK